MVVSGYWHTDTVSCLVQSSKATAGSVRIGMGDRISKSISVDSLSYETLNRSLLRCSCGDNMNLTMGLVQCNFQFFS